jgi:hypothetical protein
LNAAPLARLLAIAAAWAFGEALAYQFAPAARVPVAVLFAAGAFVLTSDMGGGGGPPKYWRGRRIDGGGRWRR